jgi:hypothetical protein
MLVIHGGAHFTLKGAVVKQSVPGFVLIIQGTPNLSMSDP